MSTDTGNTDTGKTDTGNTDAGTTDAGTTDTRNTDAERLQQIWDDTLRGQSQTGARVIARYAEPHRRYHTTAHLAAVQDRITEFATADHDLFLVRLAGFYHDAIYDIPTRELTNEDASARLSIRELSRAGLEQEDLNEVARLVRLTATHVPGSRDPNGGLLSDADLAVLGGSPEAYAHYVGQVTQEYAHLPRLDFVRGRFQILRELAGRDLFKTAKGRALNERARFNLVAECRELMAELRTAGIDPDEIGPVPGSRS